MKHALLAMITIALTLSTVVTAAAIAIDPVSEGDTEITIRNYTLPVPLEGQLSAAKVEKEKAWLYVTWVKKTANGVQVQRFWADTSFGVFILALGAAAAGADYIVAVDNWTGEVVVEKVKKSGNSVDAQAELAITGFEAGAEGVTITGLPVGGQVRSLYTTPGAWPSETVLTDGSWGDNDGVANGVIETNPPRFSGPAYVLPGELWTVALEGDGVEPAVVNAIAPGPLTRHVVSVVSHIIGSTGVPFISDLTLNNPSGLDVDGWLKFVAEGGSLDSAPTVNFRLAPGMTTSWTDVLQSAFNITTNVKGTLVVGGYPHWLLQVSSRNYAVDAQGKRFGIAIPGQPTLTPVFGQNPWIIPGLAQDAEFRTNLILAGLAPTTSSVTMRLISDGSVAATMTRDIPPYGLVQLNRVVGAFGAADVQEGHLEVTVDTGGVAAAFSVVDGSADDAAFITARPMFP
jgi:hypothetical protein